MIEALRHDDTIRKAGGRFKLTAMIQKRWLELMRGARPMIDTKGKSDLEVVIDEFLQDKLEIRIWDQSDEEPKDES